MAEQDIDLQMIRSKIDDIDVQLLKLFNQRAELVEKVGLWKLKNQKPILDQNREKFILDRVQNQNQGPLSNEVVLQLFKTMISQFRGWEHQQSLKNKILSQDFIKNWSNKRIGFLGLGLIGFSMAKRLIEIIPDLKIIGCDQFTNPQQQKILELMPQLQIVTSPTELLQRCDIVVLATPVNAVIKFLTDHGSFINSIENSINCELILDVSSTKEKVHSAAKNWKNFIGGHPLAGKETSGFENSDAHLFLNKKFVLTHNEDLAQTPSRSLNLARQLVIILGSSLVEVSPQIHDQQLALTSHLVQMISSTLSLTTAKTVEQRQWAAEQLLFGPAFIEMMRLAGSDSQIWKDIFKTNREEILKQIEDFSLNLQNIKDEAALENTFVAAKKFKTKLNSI